MKRYQNIGKTKMMMSRTIQSVCIVFAAIWITHVAATAAETTEYSPHVPTIEDCAYIDAYYATCWWKRPSENTTTVYRLGHVSSSYHPDENDEKYCESVQRRVTEDEVEIEECGFPKASLYQRFTFWVEEVIECEDKYCPTGRKSPNMEFTASTENVRLDASPTNLSIEDNATALSWWKPRKEGSYLLYVAHSRDLFYKVEYRKQSHGEEKWKMWYEGYSQKITLPRFIPGFSYEMRVFATLVSFISSYENPDEYEERSSYNLEERDWSEPSEVLVYAVPISPTPNGKLSETQHIEGNKVKLAAVVTPVVVAMFAAMVIVGYLIYWRGHCCFEVKFIKPSAFIDFDLKSEENISSESPLMSDNSSRSEETVHPVTMTTDLDWIIDDLRHKPGGTYTIELTKEIRDDDLKRHIIKSFKQEIKGSPLGDETRSNVSSGTGDDDMRKEMLEKQRQKFLSKRSLDEESIQYMKLVENDCGPESGFPTYFLSDSDHKTESHGSHESIDTDYVMEYTAVDPTATCSMIHQSEKTFKMRENHFPSAQIIETDEKSSLQHYSKDGVLPDYVMQVSMSYEDFASTMTSFLHRLTHTELSIDEGKNDEVFDRECNPIDIQNNIGEQSRNTEHVEITLCDLDSHVASSSPEIKDNFFNSEDPNIKKRLSRSGSDSLPSIDSGFVPGTPDISLVTTH